MSKLTLVAEKRAWFGPAFRLSCILCAAVSLISGRAADALARTCCSLLARYGVKIRAVEA